MVEVRTDADVRKAAVGRADLRTGAPARADGRFRIGSVTKSFVAAVVLQLVGEGRIALDAPIERYLPEQRVPRGDRITVRQLLNHTSGLHDYADFDLSDPVDLRDWIVRDRWIEHSPRDLLDRGFAGEPYGEPGETVHYSSTDYVLAGLLIEKSTGHSYPDEIRRRILRPLGLRDTSLPGRTTDIAGPHARGYAPLFGRVYDVTAENMSWGWAAGDIVSTTADVNRFHAALFGGRLLRPAEQRELTSRATTTDGTLAGGLGVGVATLSCTTLWGHDGGVPGYETLMVGSVDGRTRLALSYNPFGDAEGLPNLARNTKSLLEHTFCPTS
nr:serine hydrolase domain-containing protein [Streptomyces sp. SID3343]